MVDSRRVFLPIKNWYVDQTGRLVRRMVDDYLWRIGSPKRVVPGDLVGG